MREEIIKLVNEYETSLLNTGIDASNVNYDLLAEVRACFWNNIENFVITYNKEALIAELEDAKEDLCFMVDKDKQADILAYINRRIDYIASKITKDKGFV